MIILDLKAENILKYALLEVNDIPEKGLIGVRGPNEAGKSTVAEAICLGLYGRTFGFDSDKFEKAIKWGAPSANITLRFRVGDSEIFTVYRFFDLDGNHSARLTRDGSTKALAQGADKVTAEIARITGCDFQQYVDAFYLAQREFSIPHAQSDMLKGLLGVSELDTVADNLRADIRRDSESLKELSDQVIAAERRIHELNIDDSKLQQLQDTRDQALAGREQCKTDRQQQLQRIDDITENLAALKVAVGEAATISANAPYRAWREYADRLSAPFLKLEQCIRSDSFAEADLNQIEAWVTQVESRIDEAEGLVIESQTHAEALQEWLTLSAEPDSADERAELTYPDARAALEVQRGPIAGKRKRSGLLAVFSLFLAALAGGVWYVLNKLGEGEVHQLLTTWLSEQIPAFADEHHVYLLAATGLFGFLFIWFTGASARAGSRVQQLDDEKFRLERRAERAQNDIGLIRDVEKGSLSDSMERLAQLEDEKLSSEAEAYLAGAGLDLVSDEGWDEITRQCPTLITTLDAANDRLAPQLEHAATHADDALALAEHAVADADAEIANENNRLEENKGLREQIETDTRAEEIPRDRIAVREVSLELLKGAVRRIYTHFNLQLREYLGSLLPLFTEGRYQHLKIDDAFNVQVFSQEKNDFVSLDDLSSGTQRQLILAIRLAMSQALVDSRQSGKQTLILDEPFAFFDRERMRQSLDTFGEFSTEIRQIWVISQEFDEADAFDLMITCERDSDQLVG